MKISIFFILVLLTLGVISQTCDIQFLEPTTGDTVYCNFSEFNFSFGFKLTSNSSTLYNVTLSYFNPITNASGLLSETASLHPGDYIEGFYCGNISEDGNYDLTVFADDGNISCSSSIIIYIISNICDVNITSPSPFEIITCSSENDTSHWLNYTSSVGLLDSYDFKLKIKELGNPTLEFSLDTVLFNGTIFSSFDDVCNYYFNFSGIVDLSVVLTNNGNITCIEYVRIIIENPTLAPTTMPTTMPTIAPTKPSNGGLIISIIFLIVIIIVFIIILCIMLLLLKMCKNKDDVCEEECDIMTKSEECDSEKEKSRSEHHGSSEYSEYESESKSEQEYKLGDSSE